MMRFSGVYSNYANNRKNGINDENMLKWAEKEYQLKLNSQTFNHYHVWVVIKDSPKFRVICQEVNEGQSSSKRTKNSETSAYSPGGSDAHTNYAVNLEQDEEDNEFDIPEPVSTIGLDTIKRASSSSCQTVSSIPTTNKLAHQLEKFTKFQRAKHKEKKKIHEEKLLLADLKVMGTVGVLIWSTQSGFGLIGFSLKYIDPQPDSSNVRVNRVWVIWVMGY
ncbi:hypothetical protein R6Q59_020117 [Mikania micrantha]